MKILILGGDGFCGWPTALSLSARGHEIHIIDNFSRRRIDAELGISSLTPISSLDERLDTWERLSNKRIGFTNLDVASEPDRMASLICDFKPEAIVHFAEIRAAPYSMKSGGHKRLTVNNNISATNNVLVAIVESGLDPHLIHLGTMGVYGYSEGGTTIPEGYLKVSMDLGSGHSATREILHPSYPGSVYHMTKGMDQIMFYFYNRNDGIRITDLHQGIVWGTQTAETRLDERLINRFDYDGDYGTVLNRFLMQAAIGYPLTVYGTGGQTRAFIHLQDSVRCVELAVTHPPERGERVRIFNQMTETHTIRDLANLIAFKTGQPVQHLGNPRNEAAENDLSVENGNLFKLGLTPTHLDATLVDELVNVARRYASRCDTSKVPCTSFWANNNLPAAETD